MRKSVRCWSSCGVQPKGLRHSSVTCTTSHMTSDHTGGRPNWRKKKCMNGRCLLLLAVRIHWSSFYPHLQTASSSLSFVNQLHIALKCPDDYFLQTKCVSLKHWRWFYREVLCICETYCLCSWNDQDVWNEVNVCVIAQDKLTLSVYLSI